MKIRLAQQTATLNPHVQRIVVSREGRSNGTFWLRIFAVFGAVALILGACFGIGWSNWLSVKDTPAYQPRPIPQSERWQNSQWDGSVPIVKEYFLRTAHDPDAMEFVEWSKVYDSPKGHHEVQVSVRGKNMAGAKILKRYIVKYNQQSVLSVDPRE